MKKNKKPLFCWLDAGLHKKVKLTAVRKGVFVAEIVESALNKYFENTKKGRHDGEDQMVG